jgi:hypothetical protein
MQQLQDQCGLNIAALSADRDGLSNEFADDDMVEK